MWLGQTDRYIELRSPDAYHCSQCRKQSGHFWASIDVPRSALQIEGEENVSWYQESESVRRGLHDLWWFSIRESVQTR